MSMTWKTLTDFLTREFRNLHRMTVVSFGFANAPVLDVNDLRQEELGSAERVDTIVRDFARTRRWPALDEKERFFLRERLRFAYEYATIAEICVQRPSFIATRPEILNEQRRLVEWLLIDVWRTSGVKNWLRPFTLLARPARVDHSKWHLDVAE
ncbi:MAG TPA: hypothetical protein VK633_03595 [Verrucomicrobiae bacterium]|nr:hypothetical protein [Verrucomicrobiae bacterium]